MKPAGTIKFRDLESADEVVAIVRYDDESVAVCLSLASNGDLEVVMSKADALALLEALGRAVA